MNVAAEATARISGTVSPVRTHGQLMPSSQVSEKNVRQNQYCDDGEERIWPSCRGKYHKVRQHFILSCLQLILSIFRDTFIYEYVGDVVNPASFKKRMRDYADEGIEHFYFMMLQKDEVGRFMCLGAHF